MDSLEAVNTVSKSSICRLTIFQGGVSVLRSLNTKQEDLKGAALSELKHSPLIHHFVFFLFLKYILNDSYDHFLENTRKYKDSVA